MAHGLLSRHAFKGFEHRRTVPGLALECPPKLLVQPCNFVNRHAYLPFY